MKTYLFIVTSKATGCRYGLPVWASCFGEACNALISAYPKSQYKWEFERESDDRFFTGISCD
jgi:hypothetical protein